jgi:hypothetical protein
MVRVLSDCVKSQGNSLRLSSHLYSLPPIIGPLIREGSFSVTSLVGDSLNIL